MPRLTRSLTLTTLTICGALLMAGCAAQAGTSVEQQGTADTPGPVDTSVSASSAACDGVWLAVDFGALGEPPIDQCLSTTEPVDGLAVLAQANVTVDGTADYGLDVVCRVNGLPSADAPLNVPGHNNYRETCEKMTPEFAYWSVWVEDRATGAWDYAAVGIDALSLAPGESLGLTFTTGTHTDPPQD